MSDLVKDKKFKNTIEKQSVAMVPIIDGNSGYAAHVWSVICSFICLIFTSTTNNFTFFRKKYPFSFTCAQSILGYHLIIQ